MSERRADGSREHIRERCRQILEAGDDEGSVELAAELLAALDEIDDLDAQVEETDQLAKQLAGERVRYLELFVAAPDPYVVTDREAMIRERNEAASLVLGLAPGRALVLSISADDRHAFHRFLNATRGAGGREVLVFDSPTGPVPMDVRIHPLGPDLLLWLLRDVTEVEEARARLKEVAARDRLLAEQLRQLDETRRAFLLAVSHDLRTPLATLAGLAGLLADRSRLSEDERRTVVGQIGVTSTRLVALLGDLLDLERLDRFDLSLRRADTDIGSVIREVASRVDLGGRDLQVRVTVGRAQVDPVLVERIVENLLRNEAQHTPAGSHVWLRCSQEPDGVLLVVEDDGPGVAAEVAPKVFDLFQRDRERGGSGGLGVGLTLVRRFAELHGGYARIHDRLGGGASFHVLLPEA